MNALVASGDGCLCVSVRIESRRSARTARVHTGISLGEMQKCKRCFNKSFLKECACGCGYIISAADRFGNDRKYILGHGNWSQIVGKHGEEHPSWKGGRWFSSHGYAKVWSPSNLNRDNDGYVYEHVLQMQKFLCRALTDNEIVHHKNGIKDDNRLCNLHLMDRIEHRKYHSQRQKSQRKDLSSRHIQQYVGLWKWLMGKTISGQTPRWNYTNRYLRQ